MYTGSEDSTIKVRTRSGGFGARAQPAPSTAALSLLGARPAGVGRARAGSARVRLPMSARQRGAASQLVHALPAAGRPLAFLVHRCSLCPGAPRARRALFFTPPRGPPPHHPAAPPPHRPPPRRRGGSSRAIATATYGSGIWSRTPFPLSWCPMARAIDPFHQVGPRCAPTRPPPTHPHRSVRARRRTLPAAVRRAPANHATPPPPDRGSSAATTTRRSSRERPRLCVRLEPRALVRNDKVRAVTELQAHNTYIIKCVISPDCKRLATTSADTTVKIWDIENNFAWCAARRRAALVGRVLFPTLSRLHPHPPPEAPRRPPTVGRDARRPSAATVRRRWATPATSDGCGMRSTPPTPHT